MKKLIMILCLSFLHASTYAATITADPNQKNPVASWSSKNPEDVVTISNPSGYFQNVIVSVSEGSGTIFSSPIAFICNGKRIIVNPNSGTTCRTAGDVSWSSTDGFSLGWWSVEFVK